MAKMIVLSNVQWDVVFHILNNVSDDTWERAVQAAWQQDKVDPLSFGRYHRHALSAVTNAEDVAR